MVDNRVMSRVQVVQMQVGRAGGWKKKKQEERAREYYNCLVIPGSYSGALWWYYNLITCSSKFGKKSKCIEI
jgi:hypothetical protein